VIVLVVICPSSLIAVTSNEWAPSDPVSIGEPLATLPTHEAIPGPSVPSAQV
jgi:hypothetical protein